MATLFFLVSGGQLSPSGPLLISAGCAATSLYMALVAFRSRLVFDGARVRVQGALRTRDFDLDQVDGYRTFRSRYQSFQVICVKDRTWNVPLMKYAGDEALQGWLAGLTDLDQRDRNQLLEKIDQDQELGATPEERRGALRRAKHINMVACIVNGAAAAAFALGPAEYRMATMLTLAVAPVAAAYMLYRQPLLYGLLKSKGDPRGDVSPILIISAFGLLLGESRVNFISVGLLYPFIVLGILASLAMFYPAARKNPRLAGTLVGLVFLSVFYGWGLAASADTAADPSTPQTYSAQVLGGHVTRGSRSSSYYLKLEPWGPYADATPEMKVSARMYYATRPGDLVCLALHEGALHAPWYEPVACQAGTQ